jgi:hypothetical protein
MHGFLSLRRVVWIRILAKRGFIAEFAEWNAGVGALVGLPECRGYRLNLRDFHHGHSYCAKRIQRLSVS